MLRHGYEFLRYVDDMRVFALSEPSARKALAELIVELRAMGLYVASAKTAIRKTDDVLTELAQGRERIAAIEEEIESQVPERLQKAASMLEVLFLDIINDPDHLNDRQFRYCVNRFKRLQVSGLGGDIHDCVISEVLHRLESMPYSTDVFVDYLSVFPDNHYVQNRVTDFVESPYNIYPWQEMHLLELLVRSNIAPEHCDRILAIARTVARSRLKHPACRAKGFLLCGKNGDYADRRDIRSCFYNEPREDVQRAIMVAIQEMQRGERDYFMRGISSASKSIAMTSKYVRSLKWLTTTIITHR